MTVNRSVEVSAPARSPSRSGIIKGMTDEGGRQLRDAVINVVPLDMEVMPVATLRGRLGSPWS